MWPAGVEPAARRVSNGRSTGLSYGHVGWARLDSNQRRLVCWTSTLARLSYSPTRSEELRDKGSNLGLHVQSVASCPLDDPGSQTGARSCPPSTSCGEVDAVAPQVAAVCWSFMSRTAETERCCPSHSPALRPWITLFGVLRGGDLEPGALAASEKGRQK